VHEWLGRYEAGGLEGLVDRSHRPASCPHQMTAEVEVVVLELRRQHPAWGPRRIRVELARRAVPPLPSESGVYRAGLIEAGVRRRRRESWKRWEGGAPMELWQMDVVGGIGLADGSSVKALTGLDDHSRYCVSAALMPAERTRAVCDGLAATLRRYGLPQQLLTDNGKLFTGRFAHPPVEVLFDRICAGVRDRAPAHRPAVADDHRQDRAIPPEPARRVPHRPGVFLVADRAVRGR
jgi:transposase InsO family protein